MTEFICNDVHDWSGEFTGDNVIRNGEFCGDRKPIQICVGQEFSAIFVDVQAYPTDYIGIELHEVSRDNEKVIFESDFIHHVLPIANQYNVTNVTETIAYANTGIGPGFYNCTEFRSGGGNYYTTKNIKEYKFKIMAMICYNELAILPRMAFWSLQQEFKSIAGEDLFGQYIDNLGGGDISCDSTRTHPPTFVNSNFKTYPCVQFVCQATVYNTHISFKRAPYVM